MTDRTSQSRLLPSPACIVINEPPIDLVEPSDHHLQPETTIITNEPESPRLISWGAPYLPQELLLQILTHAVVLGLQLVPPSHISRHLKSYALVSRAWTNPARILLYRRVHLASSRAALRFVRTLERDRDDLRLLSRSPGNMKGDDDSVDKGALDVELGVGTIGTEMRGLGALVHELTFCTRIYENPGRVGQYPLLPQIASLRSRLRRSASHTPVPVPSHKADRPSGDRFLDTVFLCCPNLARISFTNHYLPPNPRPPPTSIIIPSPPITPHTNPPSLLERVRVLHIDAGCQLKTSANLGRGHWLARAVAPLPAHRARGVGEVFPALEELTWRMGKATEGKAARFADLLPGAAPPLERKMFWHRKGKGKKPVVTVDLEATALNPFPKLRRLRLIEASIIARTDGNFATQGGGALQRLLDTTAATLEELVLSRVMFPSPDSTFTTPPKLRALTLNEDCTLHIPVLPALLSGCARHLRVLELGLRDPWSGAAADGVEAGAWPEFGALERVKLEWGCVSKWAIGLLSAAKRTLRALEICSPSSTPTRPLPSTARPHRTEKMLVTLARALFGAVSGSLEELTIVRCREAGGAGSGVDVDTNALVRAITPMHRLRILRLAVRADAPPEVLHHLPADLRVLELHLDGDTMTREFAVGLSLLLAGAGTGVGVGVGSRTKKWRGARLGMLETIRIVERAKVLRDAPGRFSKRAEARAKIRRVGASDKTLPAIEFVVIGDDELRSHGDGPWDTLDGLHPPREVETRAKRLSISLLVVFIFMFLSGGLLPLIVVVVNAH